MSSILPLGRTINSTVSVTTAVKRVNLANYSGVLLYLTNSTGATAWTINEANASSGGTSQLLSAGLPIGTPYWTQATGTGVWTQSTMSTAGTVTSINGAGALHAVWVPQGALSDGFNYITASHATGTTILNLMDVDVRRKVTNLRDVTL